MKWTGRLKIFNYKFCKSSVLAEFLTVILFKTQCGRILSVLVPFYPRVRTLGLENRSEFRKHISTFAASRTMGKHILESFSGQMLYLLL